MGLDGVVSLVVTGLVIGALGRLVVPGRQPLGCLMTLVAGIVGAAVGSYVAVRVDLTFWPTVGVQVAVAAVLVALLAGAAKRR
jgi:uncharacterized membrane protein YeaQ/YmgE (transglycosylase-associated protein family)